MYMSTKSKHANKIYLTIKRIYHVAFWKKRNHENQFPQIWFTSACCNCL